jgi:hypothetical protein
MMSPSAQIAHYRITAKLGEGGMGVGAGARQAGGQAGGHLGIHC